MQFADDIILIGTTKKGVKQKLERWRDMEETGLKIKRKKMEHVVLKAEDAGEDVLLLVVKLKRRNTLGSTKISRRIQ